VVFVLTLSVNHPLKKLQCTGYIQYIHFCF